MRARAAYMRSLGTTSILVAASLLMLAMVGAIVGFHRWPAGAAGDPIPSVPLKAPPQRVLSAVRTVRKAPTVTRIARPNPPSRKLSTAGLVKVVPVRAPQPIGFPEAVTPGHVVPNGDTPPPPAAAHDDPAPDAPAPPSAPPPPPAVGQIETLLGQLSDPVPLPPDQVQVTVPLTGITLSLPPGPAR